MKLDVECGVHSARGTRPANDDCAGIAAPDSGDAQRGWIAVIADGVAQAGRGAEAARASVRGLLTDYHGAPDTWETTVTLDRLLGAQNTWLVAHNRQRRGAGDPGRGLTTCTVLVLQGRGWTVAHLGDTRAWRLQGSRLQALTEDHAVDHPDLRHQLTRALGLDDALHVDYAQGELAAGDLFVLTSDGVHGVLDAGRMAQLAAAGDAQQACVALVDAALAAGSRDNASAVVVRVRNLPASGLDDALRRARQLPVPARLRVGDRLDGFQVTALVADNGLRRLFQARELASGDLVALKTLHPARAADAQELAMLAHEAWLAGRVGASDRQGFVQVRTPAEPSALYVAFDWHAGQTLAQREEEERAGRRARCSAAELLDAGLALGRALGRLHRTGVVHRDINPRNLHRSEDGQWRILDLGVALSGREPPELRTLHAGTPSYMNPEQWLEGADGSGTPADAAGDVFALGVTLYEWLTGALPYGEIEPWQLARYRRDPLPVTRRRPDVPVWLDHVLRKAVARDRRLRFDTAEEFVLALERGAARPLPAPGATPLAARDPLVLWRAALALSLLFNALLLYWLLFLPR
jgi:serine/threonine protein phosphatase PrpC